MKNNQDITNVYPDLGSSHFPTPDLININLPSVETPWKYAAHYWRGTIRNLLIKHRLQSVNTPCYATDFHLSPVLKERWKVFFDKMQPHLKSNSDVPFLYSQSVGTLLYTKIFSDLNFNFRHLLHVKHKTEYPKGASAYIQAHQQNVACRLKQVSSIPRNRALVILEAQITNSDKELIGRVEDSFLIRNLKPEDIKKIPKATSSSDELMGLRRRTSKLESDIESTSQQTQIGNGMARGFGNISGDMNPVHTSNLGAKLFGFKRPFLQGLCVRNLVTHWLADKNDTIDQIEMTFTNPAYVQQCALLREKDGYYEVVSEEGQLIAFGHVNRPPNADASM
ncbi:MaoC/PaaZ C-terminal domain-containing protein [Halomonas sp. LS-001]